MLGEKRSRAAFQEDSGEGVQTVGCAAHGKPEVENTGTKYTNTGGAKAEEPAPPLSGEAYLDSLLNGCLGRKPAGCPESTEKAMGAGIETVPADTDESRQIRGDAVNRTKEIHRSVAGDAQHILTGDMEPSGEESPESGETTAAHRRDARTLRTHGLFFEADAQGRDFSSVLKEVQAYLSKEYSSLVTAEGSEDARAQIRRFAGKYIQDHRISVPGMDTEELIAAIYSEMAEFGFLTKYIYGEGIEEIDINAWDDVEVQFAGGVTEKLTEHFDSPEHAINVVRRMLHVSGMVLDDASPSVLGHLSKNIRIAVLKTPIVDEDVGVAASIRIVNPQSMKKQDFIKGGTATGQMLDFLAECIRYGISVYPCADAAARQQGLERGSESRKRDRADPRTGASGDIGVQGMVRNPQGDGREHRPQICHCRILKAVSFRHIPDTEGRNRHGTAGGRL